jgi:hypothetical protein
MQIFFESVMIPTGWIIPLPIILPNLLWVAISTSGSDASEVPPTGRLVTVLSAVETAGRVAVFVVPFFLNLYLTTTIEQVCLGVAAFALALYYAGWVRYFVGGRRSVLLWKSLFQIPVPLAVAPVIYFLAASVLAGSTIFGAITVIFGFAHIYLSFKRSRICQA